MQLTEIKMRDLTEEMLDKLREKVQSLCGTAYLIDSDNSTEGLAFDADGTAVLHGQVGPEKYTREQIAEGDIGDEDDTCLYKTAVEVALDYIAYALENEYMDWLFSQDDEHAPDDLLLDALMHNATYIKLSGNETNQVRTQLQSVSVE